MPKMLRCFMKAFLSTSTIHGLNHLTQRNRHTLEVLLWCVLVGSSVYAISIFSSLALRRYMENPTVISMERDRFSWNTSFPSVTICPSVKLSQNRLESFLAASNATNKTELRTFLKTLSEATYDTFSKVTPYSGISPEGYWTLLLDLAFDFKPSITYSGKSNVNGGPQQIITEMGICYSFNSQLAVYSSPGYRMNGSWGLLEQEEIFYVNPLDGDVFASLINVSSGTDIYVHGPYEIPDVATKVIHSQDGYYLQIRLSAVTIFSTSRTRHLRINQRKCKYHDESDLSHSPVYSFVLCRIECRIGLAKKLCGCIPHFYRQLDGEKVCDVEGLHCLANYSERLKTVQKECSCLPNCDDVNYILEEYDSRYWFLGSNLQWGLKDCPKMRLKRDVIFGFTDLLVYIGGMAGLFLGCSVLSFIEILYFFTMRLCCFVKGYREAQLTH